MKKLLSLMLLVIVLTAGCSNSNHRNEAEVPADQSNNAPQESPSNGGGVTAGNEASSETDQGHQADSADDQDAIAPFTDLVKGQYAFADETGRQLLTLEGETPAADKTRYRYAIGDTGKVLPITYVKEQKGDDQDTGRQTMQNFAHTAGALYQVSEGAAEPNATYFLSESEAWKSATLQPVDVTVRGEQVEDEVVAAIAKKLNRNVDYAAKVADLDNGDAIYLAQFERQGASMLAAIVLQQGNRYLAYAMPATYNESGTWRVDDGGELHAEEFSVLFAAATDKGQLLGLTWLGAEGENAFMVVEEGDQLQAAGESAGRYMMPL